MGSFIYGLAVALLLFEGIITQCEGTKGARGVEDDASAAGTEGPTSSMQFQPIERVIGMHVPVTVTRIKSGKFIILIKPDYSDKDGIDSGYYVSDEHENGDVELTFANYNEIESFLEIYGQYVKKIHITMKSKHYQQRILNILKEYKNNLEELRISSYFDDEKFWKEFSNGNTFLKMKTFKMDASIEQRNFKLHSIFPELEYLTLDGSVTDENCLANMDHLKELTLKTTSIPEKKLDSIFQKNNGITMIHLKEPKMRETMQSIAEHLKNLKELVASLPGENFLLQKKGDPICEFPEMEKFTIIFDEMHKVYEIEKLTFKMPKLRELNLCGKFDGQFLKFIKHFETLDILRFDTNVDDEFLQLVGQTWAFSKLTRIGYFDYLEFKKSDKK